MEIKNISKAYSAYNQVKLSKPTGMTSSNAVSGTKNTDKVDFNHTAQIETAKADISAVTRADASPERIAQLREKIEQGSYYVASEQLSSIISGLVSDF